jgi:hypothetical protein
MSDKAFEGMEMMRTLEATIDEKGIIRLLEPIEISGTHRVLVTILEEEPEPAKLRPYGLCAGDFTVPDDFNEPLPEDILRQFEGSS